MEVNHLSLSETFCICTGYIREWRMLLLLVVDSHSWRDGLASATARDRGFSLTPRVMVLLRSHCLYIVKTMRITYLNIPCTVRKLNM